MLPRLLSAVPRRSCLALHADQQGSVQSLSFVLTVPFFIMLMLLAVQITQLMIGEMIVHYAAFAAARSASVWIAADDGVLSENRIGQRQELYQNDVGIVYQIQPGSMKYERIRQAAALACVSIAPSRNWGPAPVDSTTTALQNVYAALAPQ